MSRQQIVVVGGGISGLTTAYRLRQRLGSAADIVLVEASERLGGLLLTDEIDGVPMELGAEAFVARRPEVPNLLAELGLSDSLVSPSGLRPLIWAHGRANRFPERTVQGIPAAADSLGELVDEETRERIAAEPTRPLSWIPGSDTDIASLIGDRFGEQTVTRSVEPLLGGVYAGAAKNIGLRAALPALAAALDRGANSLTEAVKQCLPPADTTPVFGCLRGGYRVLTDALRNVAHPEVHTGVGVTEVRRDGSGWRVDPIGPAAAVVLATPAPVTARLLQNVVPEAAHLTGGIAVSSSVVVALATSTPLPENSGILVATGEALRAKAFTFSTRKWPHLTSDNHLLRVSFGRFGDSSAVRWPEEGLRHRAIADASTVLGTDLTTSVAKIARWPVGLPQYTPGHTARIASLEKTLAGTETLAITGSYLRGVGVPACVAQATAAAHRIVTALTGSRG